MEKNIFSLLSDDEKTLMERYIDDYSYGNCDRTASLEYILRYWTKNKAHLVEKFGGQLILKKTFSYQIPDAQLQNEYNFAIPDKCRSYMSTLWTRIFNMCYKLAVPDPDPSHPTYFGNTGYFFDKSNLIHQKFTPENGEPADFLLPDGTTLRANPGDKNIRILNKLAKAFDMETPTLEEYRIFQSNIVAMAMKGKPATLVLSVHPMDYITMSDNNCDWDSCMRWMGDEPGGCYRRGTVEMMNSPCVVVAYLESETPFYPCFNLHTPWSNKKWRTLFVVDDEIIAQIRSYPYSDPILIDECMEWLGEIMNFRDREVHEFWNDGYAGRLVPVNTAWSDIHIEFYCNAMYNDFLYTHQIMVNRGIESLIDNTLCMNYSGPSVCMACGQASEDDDRCFFEDTANVVCDECGNFDYIYCAECGERIDPHSDNYFTLPNGDVVCEDCYSELTTYDEIYDEDIFNDDAADYYIYYQGKATDMSLIASNALWVSDIIAKGFLGPDDRYKSYHSYNCEYGIDLEYANKRVLRALLSKYAPYWTMRTCIEDWTREDLLNAVIENCHLNVEPQAGT